MKIQITRKVFQPISSDVTKCSFLIMVKLIGNLNSYTAWTTNGRESIGRNITVDSFLFSYLSSLKSLDINVKSGKIAVHLILHNMTKYFPCTLPHMSTYLQECWYARRYACKKGMKNSTFPQFIGILIGQTAPTTITTQTIFTVVHTPKQSIVPFTFSRAFTLTVSPSLSFSHIVDSVRQICRRIFLIMNLRKKVSLDIMDRIVFVFPSINHANWLYIYH